MAIEFGLNKNSYEHQAIFKINSTILSSVLLMHGPDCITTIRNMDVTNMPPKVFNVLPEALHEVCDGFFFIKYSGVLIMFFPFFMIPITEFFIFLIFVKMYVPYPKMPTRPQYSKIPQSEFV